MRWLLVATLLCGCTNAAQADVWWLDLETDGDSPEIEGCDYQTVELDSTRLRALTFLDTDAGTFAMIAGDPYRVTRSGDVVTLVFDTRWDTSTADATEQRWELEFGDTNVSGLYTVVHNAVEPCTVSWGVEGFPQ